MAQRNVSPHATGSASEYATNWTSLLSAAIVVLLAGSVLALPLLLRETRPVPTDAKSRGYSRAVQAVADVADADTGRAAFKPLQVRPTRFADDDEAPLFDVRDRYAWYGSAARTIAHGGAASGAASPTEAQWRVSLLLSPVELVLRSDAAAALLYQPTAQQHRRQWQSQDEDDLRQHLTNRVREIDLDSVQGTSQALFDAGKSNKFASLTGDAHLAMLQKLAAERSDMAGLPLRLEGDCKTSDEVAKLRQPLAQLLRSLTDERTFSRLMAMKDQDLARVEEYFLEIVDKKANWNNPQQVAMLEQVLQAGLTEHRLMLVHFLQQIEGREASAALARRTIFDLDETVRAAARSALAERDWSEYSGVVSRANLVPLASTASADFAARKACAAAEAPGRPAPSLYKTPTMLDSLTSVSRPFLHSSGAWVVDELVKVNHLRNCTLCHPASTSTSDPLRGPIPQPDQPLPRVYYSESTGNFVRADVVYIRQEFSVMLPVENAHPWPKMQRFDFFVRRRPASAVELHDEAARCNQVQDLVHRAAVAISNELDWWRNRWVRVDPMH